MVTDKNNCYSFHVSACLEKNFPSVCENWWGYRLSNICFSPYCMTEFDMAYHHNVVEKRKKRLIVLMMLDNPADLYANYASDTATLRQYLRQYTYIDYRANDWLDKLLYALPVHGLLQHNKDPNDDVLLHHIEDRNDDNEDDDVQLLQNV